MATRITRDLFANGASGSAKEVVLSNGKYTALVRRVSTHRLIEGMTSNDSAPLDQLKIMAEIVSESLVDDDGKRLYADDELDAFLRDVALDDLHLLFDAATNSKDLIEGKSESSSETPS